MLGLVRAAGGASASRSPPTTSLRRGRHRRRGARHGLSEPFDPDAPDALAALAPHRCAAFIAERPRPPPRRRRRAPRHGRLARASASSTRRPSAGTRCRSAPRCATRSAAGDRREQRQRPGRRRAALRPAAATRESSSSSRSAPVSAAGIVVDGVVSAGAPAAPARSATCRSRDDGPLCSCGNRGCLEAIVGEAALRRAPRASRRDRPEGGIAALRGLPTAATSRPARSSREAGASSAARSPASCTPSTPRSSCSRARASTAWPHWAAASSRPSAGTLIPSRRGISVVVESGRTRWAQGAAALVLATPFDSTGVAGDQGRLVRERLQVGAVGAEADRPMTATEPAALPRAPVHRARLGTHLTGAHAHGAHPQPPARAPQRPAGSWSSCCRAPSRCSRSCSAR